jgi:hypothetical protein
MPATLIKIITNIDFLISRAIPLNMYPFKLFAEWPWPRHVAPVGTRGLMGRGRAGNQGCGHLVDSAA